MNSIRVPLSQGKFALVDEGDAVAARSHRWRATKRKKTYYAIRSFRRADGTRGTVFLHTFLAGFRQTDHRNGNGLDNRRANLREASTAQNAANQGIKRSNTSGFKGVSLERGRWRAQIRILGKKVNLGRYQTPELAARAYDKAAREYHGEFATLNFPAANERGAR